MACLLVILTGGAISTCHEARGQDCAPGAFGCNHHQGHDQYKQWKSRNGGSCCSGHDCRPVRAKQDINGDWWAYIPEYRQWIIIPASAMLPPDKLGDGRSHLCSSDPLDSRLPFLAIYCFTPGQVRG